MIPIKDSNLSNLLEYFYKLLNYLITLLIMESVQSVMKSFSITGNIYVDGIIATTAFGMMKGWLDIILSILKSVLGFIWIRIRYIFIKTMSSKFGGTELYKVS